MTRSGRIRRVMEGLQIRNESGDIRPLTFSESQEHMWRHVAPQLDAHSRLWFIVLKGRQVYSTTFWSALSFVRTIEKPNTYTTIIAHQLDSAQNIFGMATRFYEHLPLPHLKPSRVKQIDFIFPEGDSQIVVLSAGKVGKGRGTTQTCVLCSEVPYWPNPEVLPGLFQTIPSHVGDTLWVLEGTANGMTGVGAPFYDEWKAAIDGRSQLMPIFVPWFTMRKYRLSTAIPEDEWDEEEKVLVDQFGVHGLDGHSLAWRRFCIDTRCYRSVDLFRQEYPSSPEEAFLSSGLPAFERLALMKQQKNIAEPRRIGEMVSGKFQVHTRGWVSVWREPEEGHQYVVGVDAAEGIKGGDYACAQVLDMATMEQVAMIHGWIEPWDMARQIAQLGRWYQNAMVAVEMQGQGRSIQDYLLRVFSYPNLHLWRGRQDSIRPVAPKLYGWETNTQTRPLLIEAGRRALNAGLATVHDRSTLDELYNFSRDDKGKYVAEIGHDDRVLALLIAFRSREENYAGGGGMILSPGELSLTELPGGIRILASRGDHAHARMNVHKALSKQARRGAKTWLEY